MMDDTRKIADELRDRLTKADLVVRLEGEISGEWDQIGMPLGICSSASDDEISVELWTGNYFEGRRPIWVGVASTKSNPIKKIGEFIGHVKLQGSDWDEAWNLKSKKGDAFEAEECTAYEPSPDGKFYLGRYLEMTPETIDKAHSFLTHLLCGLSPRPDLETEKRALKWIRTQQKLFRDRVGEVWGDKCAVTRCDIPEALRASHIKPWATFPKDRLDSDNGLLLIGTLDALFDCGLITFEDDGLIIISKRIPREKHESAGLRDSLRLRKPLNDGQKERLKWHREKHFVDRRTELNSQSTLTGM